MSGTAPEIKTLEDLKGAFLQTSQDLKSFVEKANGEIEAAGKVSSETKAALETLAEKANGYGDRIDKIEGRLNSKFDDGRAEAKSLGAQFIETDEYKAISEGKSQTARMQVKAIVNATGEGQPLVPEQRVPGIIHEPERMLTIRDMLASGRTSSNLVKFARESVYTNNAGPQYQASPEARENISKPESNITFTDGSAEVITLAHFILVSRQVLSDAPMLQSYIDGRLRYGLKLEEEDEILNGDGSGGQLDGLRNQQTAYSRAQSGDTKIDTLRRAITQAQLANYMVDGIIVNPADWEEIELTKTSENAYVFASPARMAAAAMWGKPVLVTNTMPAGQFQVGSYQLAAQIWDREDATVELSREDGDNFRKNMVTVLAEERLALTVYRAQSIIGGAF